MVSNIEYRTLRNVVPELFGPTFKAIKHRCIVCFCNYALLICEHACIDWAMLAKRFNIHSPVRGKFVFVLHVKVVHA